MLIKGALVLADPRTEPAEADILIEDDRIAAVGQGIQASPGMTVIDARDHLAMPGLVNAHTHAHHNLPRSFSDGLPLEMWVPYMSAWGPNRSPRELYVGAAIGAIEMARTEQAEGEFPDAIDMAESIVTSQQAEIDQIEQLLGS